MEVAAMGGIVALLAMGLTTLAVLVVAYSVKP
jgi:hypothetical protein